MYLNEQTQTYIGEKQSITTHLLNLLKTYLMKKPELMSDY